MAIEYFCCYHSYLKKCEKLSDQELGRLFRALMVFSATGERAELTGRECIAFDFIADDIDRAKETYAEKCRKNAESGAAGAEARWHSDRHKTDGENSDRHFEHGENGQNKYKDKYKNKDKETSSLTDNRFEQFWQAYPRKVGKGNARQAWAKIKMTDDLFDTILNAVEQQKQWEQWQRDNGQYIPHPATWLNGQRWEDSGIAVPTKQKDPHREAWLKNVQKLIN